MTGYMYIGTGRSRFKENGFVPQFDVSFQKLSMAILR